MTTTTIKTIKPATDEEIKTWLQAELRASLQNGLAWLEQPVELAIEEALERPETPAADLAETMASVRNHLERASRAAAEGEWSEVTASIRWLEEALAWVFPGAPGSRARALQEQLDTVKTAVEAAQLEPSSTDWRAWRGPEYCQLLLDQPWYSEQGLYTALEAWQRGADLTIEEGSPQVIETE